MAIQGVNGMINTGTSMVDMLRQMQAQGKPLPPGADRLLAQAPPTPAQAAQAEAARMASVNALQQAQGKTVTPITARQNQSYTGMTQSQAAAENAARLAATQARAAASPTAQAASAMMAGAANAAKNGFNGLTGNAAAQAYMKAQQNPNGTPMSLAQAQAMAQQYGFNPATATGGVTGFGGAGTYNLNFNPANSMAPGLAGLSAPTAGPGPAPLTGGPGAPAPAPAPAAPASGGLFGSGSSGGSSAPSGGSTVNVNAAPASSSGSSFGAPVNKRKGGGIESKGKGEAKHFAKGGKIAASKWEGSKKDEAQDKKLAKKRGMSMKAWEKSKMDEKHDKQQSMKGLKKGGTAKAKVKKMCGGGMGYKAGGAISGKKADGAAVRGKTRCKIC